jgi:hypothetical protein
MISSREARAHEEAAANHCDGPFYQTSKDRTSTH